MSDMTRYVNADKLCEALKSMASVQYPDKQNTILGVVSSIENFPTADVVPKSEVEELTRENESLAKTVNEASELVRKLRSKVKKSKSEVEELEAECERQYEQAKADILANMADGGTSCHWCIDEHKAQAKAEVAREIFEEIDKIFNDYKLSERGLQLIQHREPSIDQRYAELKKKYIGGNDNG